MRTTSTDLIPPRNQRQLTETWITEGEANFAIRPAGFCEHHGDRTKALSGKARGGGGCLMINTSWCNQGNVHTLKAFCSLDLEYLMLMSRPHWLPHEFTAVIAMVEGSDFKFLHISEDLTRTTHATHVTEQAQQRLHSLKQFKKFRVSPAYSGRSTAAPWRTPNRGQADSEGPRSLLPDHQAAESCSPC